ncbi:hypothetical protein WJX72_002514 [[Myrmecia] bisecta]|uniref:Uncharacterized protein n=1 Tax=[Myrmecia] bisecta TaxID=41462 RepID=A0AAW1R5D3_9CHLO
MRLTGASWTLLAVTAVTLAGIGWIHAGQRIERENLHQGVLRDDELYAKKLLERRQQQTAQQSEQPKP